MVTRDRQPQTGIAGERQHILYRAFTKAAFAHHQTAVMILQRTSDDFGRRRRTGINQHNHGQTASSIARHSAFGPVTLRIALIATALGHDFTAVEEGIGHGHRLIQYPARVGPQIKNITQRFATQCFLDA